MPAPVTAPARWRVEGRAAVELFALCGFAIAQPVLDVFGRAPEQFVFRGATGADIVRWAVAVTVVPPLVLWGVEAAIAAAARGSRAWVHGAFVALLVGAVVVQAARSVVPGALLFALAAGAGAGAVVLWRRARAFRLWLSYAALAPLAFLGLFLITSETSRLVSGDDVPTAGSVIESPAPVVLVVFDELPLTAVIRSDGTIDAELFPNLAELAAGSHWFRQATTVSSSTWHAVPAIATGRYPDAGAAPIAADHPENLFTLLGGAIDLSVTESITRLCPASLCALTDRSGSRTALLGDAADVLRARLSWSGEQGDPVAGLVEDPVGEALADVPDDDGFADFELNQPTRFRALLDGIEDARPALHYLHVLLPHVPYRYLPSGARYEAPDPDLGRDGDDWLPEPWLVALGRQRLELQVAYVDALLGELVATLRERGVYDDAAIVVTADHGISFQPGGAIRAIEGQELTADSRGELLWVPLIVKEPGQVDGRVSDAPVATIDVLPTIADLLDVHLPWAVDGRSVLGPPREIDDRRFYPSDVGPFGVDAGDPVPVDGARGYASVLEHAVDRSFPPPGGPDRLFRTGPAPELVGTEVSAVLPEVGMTLRDPGALDVDRASGTVPALLRGGLEGVEPGDAVAIAVNGVVGATAPVIVEDGRPAFAVIVSDALFRSGPNVVTAHRIPRP